METPQYDLQSSDAQKLKKQLEFYFSNSNYPRDKFLRGVAAENDGFVPIKVLTTFNRVKNLSQDLGFITAVLSSSDELEVHDGKVKRKTAVPEKDTSIDRSIYIKGLPLNNPGVTIESVSEFFSKFGEVLAIRLRRHKNKDFKGSAYIEFKNEEDAKKVTLLTDLRWSDESAPFIILTKENHLAEKREELKSKKSRMEQTEKENTENPIKSEKTENSENSVKSEKTENSEDPENPIKSEKTEKTEKKEKAAYVEKKNPDFEMPTNFKLLEVKNVPDGIDIYDLKAHFSKFGKPKFIDTTEKDVITVRFYEVDHVDVAYNEIKDTKFEIRGNLIEARIIEKEEAEQYWNDKIKPQINKSVGGRGGRGQFKRGRGRSRGRGGRGKGGPPYKKRRLNPNE